MMAKMTRLVLLLGLMLTACGPATRPAPTRASPEAPPATPSAAPPAVQETAGAGTAAAAPSLISCEAQLGPGPARALANRCRAVSPATHPPCNAANSCALIRDEIARGCSLLGDAAAGTPECGQRPSSAEAAADVIRRYYEAIAARDYATAYSQWRADGEGSGQSYDDFSKGFARTRTTTATLGPPGEVEGAAGSLYVTIPVTLDAVLEDGTRQRFSGAYVLRMINGVDGATAEQLRWKIASATLRPTP